TGISYDLEHKPIVLKGVITEFRWKNPHVSVFIDVKGPDGKVVNWSLEGSSIANYARMGFNRNTLKTGQEVTALVYVSKVPNNPVRGRNKGEPLNGDHPGFVRAVIPALSNDPIMKCDPQGIPRLILDNEPTEWFMAPGRLMQFFQWGHIPREIWLDGRALPSGENLDNLGDSWFGMSVGKWEGDTLVVNTVGQRDKSWIDIHGFPHSFNMRLEERYKRVSYDRIQWTFTIYDPEIYKTPWESDVKGFRRMKDEEVTFYGWKGFSGFLEGYCAETEEQEFNDRVRDPAGLGHKQ